MKRVSQLRPSRFGLHTEHGQKRVHSNLQVDWHVSSEKSKQGPGQGFQEGLIAEKAQ